ncbi:MAG: hypothetical protein ACJ75G_12240 [Gaiellaceae bacterium]
MSGKLGYPFDPQPKWVRQMWEAGALSAERRDILYALTGRADSAVLKLRKPTPKLAIASLAAAVGRPTDAVSLEALKRLLRLMRGDALLDYTTSGAGSRTLYLFTLFVDGPRRSGVVPGSSEAAVPPSPGGMNGSDAAFPASGAQVDAGLASAEENSDVPGEAASIPRSEGVAKLHSDTDSELVANASIPGSSEPSENSAFSDVEIEVGPGERLRARAREASDGPTGDPIADAILARRGKAPAWGRSLPRRERAIVHDLYELLGAREVSPESVASRQVAS